MVLKVGQQYIPYQGFPNQYMDMTGNRSTFANLGYDRRFDWGKLLAKVYWQRTEHEMGFFSAERTGTMPMDAGPRHGLQPARGHRSGPGGPAYFVWATNSTASTSMISGRRYRAR
jgi:hypothetical protein